MDPFLFPRNPGGRTPGLHGLLIACGSLFLLQLIFQGAEALPVGGTDAVTRALSLRPGAEPLWTYRFFTFGFLHAGFLHLFFNLLTLYFLGKPIEERLGTRHFLLFYFGAVFSTGVLTHLHAWALPWAASGGVVGASGALCALLVLFWRMHPDATVMFFFVLPVPIRYFLYVAMAVDAAGTFFRLPTGLAHATHFAGYLYGFTVLGAGYLLESRSRRPRESSAVGKTVPLSRVSPDFSDRDRYYQSRVDPILKKISSSGMDSLTGEEVETLRAASRYRKAHH